MLKLAATGTAFSHSTWHLLRATLRDWWVLWREFRTPLFLFLLINGGVAFLFYTYYTHPAYSGGVDFDEALLAVLTLNVFQPILPIPSGRAARPGLRPSPARIATTSSSADWATSAAA
jgi:hypothetical protein